MCQLSYHRLCWTMCDPYEKQLLMIAVQNAAFVDGCMAMVLVWRHRPHAAWERRRVACRGQAVAMGAVQVANGLCCSGTTYSACACLVLLGFLARCVSQTQQRCSSIREGLRTGPASDAGMEALDDTGEATRPHVAAGSAQCEAAPSSSHASRFDSPADCDRRTTGAREGSTRNVPLRCIPVANQSATA